MSRTDRYKNCGTCGYGKRRGWTMVYCTFFGIDIRADYARCGSRKDSIIVEEGNAQIVIKPAAEDVRGRQVS